MIARLVDRRDHAGASVVLTALAAAALLAVALDDLVGMRFVPLRPDATGFVTVGALYAVAALSPLLRRASHPRTVEVAPHPEGLSVGGTVVRREDVTAAAVAAAARGRSVAIARGERVFFLEVEGDADAAALLRALGVNAADRGVAVPVPRRGLALAAVAISALLVAFGAFHLASAFDLVAHEWKTPLGVGAVLLAQLSATVAVARARLTRRVDRGEDVARGTTAYDEHARLHVEDRVEGAEPHAGDPRVRVAGLARGEESTAAWLARLDAIPTAEGAYRGAAATKDVLWDTLVDDAAPVDARAAEARVLRRRFGEDGAVLADKVSDPDVRVRVEAALDDDAAELLDALGPVFRAR